MTLPPPLPAKITKEEIATLPQEEYVGQIVVVDRPEDVARAVAELSAEARVGFDTETRPNFRKDQHHKVSLIQVLPLSAELSRRYSGASRELPL